VHVKEQAVAQLQQPACTYEVCSTYSRFKDGCLCQVLTHCGVHIYSAHSNVSCHTEALSGIDKAAVSP